MFILEMFVYFETERFEVYHETHHHNVIDLILTGKKINVGSLHTLHGYIAYPPRFSGELTAGLDLSEHTHAINTEK